MFSPIPIHLEVFSSSSMPMNDRLDLQETKFSGVLTVPPTSRQGTFSDITFFFFASGVGLWGTFRQDPSLASSDERKQFFP